MGSLKHFQDISRGSQNILRDGGGEPRNFSRSAGEAPHKITTLVLILDQSLKHMFFSFAAFVIRSLFAMNAHYTLVGETPGINNTNHRCGIHYCETDAVRAPTFEPFPEPNVC